MENEPYGFAIDNVFFEPIGASILFREMRWPPIPGWNHVGFHIGNVVYESIIIFPSKSGTYVSVDGVEKAKIDAIDGVQKQHTRATFLHNSKEKGKNNTPVKRVDEIPVDEELAIKMRNAIESVLGQPYTDFLNIEQNIGGPTVAFLSASAQKGGNKKFTCVGLIEWAAEEAEVNDGEGFIRNIFESFTVTVPIGGVPIEVPLFSPSLLHWSMKRQPLLQRASQWLQGFADPVDFIVTDPLGRKLGFVQDIGFMNEIPNAFYSGDGGVEQFLIPNSIPGTYIVESVGTNDDAFIAVGALGASKSYSGHLARGETKVQGIFVDPKPGTGGDVDWDGDVDNDDIQALIPQLNRFTDGLGDPGDLDGDGLLSEFDLLLLTELVKELDDVDVNSMIVIDVPRAGGDMIWLKGGVRSASWSDPFDPLSDDVELTIGGITVVVPAGSFTNRSALSPKCYYYNGGGAFSGDLSMILNFDKCSWRALLHDTDVDSLVEGDGTAVSLRIGENFGSDSFKWSKKHFYSWLGEQRNVARYYGFPTIFCSTD